MAHTSQDEFVLVNNVLKTYNDMKEEIKNLKTSTVHQRFWYIDKTMLLFEKQKKYRG